MGKREARRGTCRNASIPVCDQKAPRFELLLDFPRFLVFLFVFWVSCSGSRLPVGTRSDAWLDLTFLCSSSNEEMLSSLHQTDQLPHPRWQRHPRTTFIQLSRTTSWGWEWKCVSWEKTDLVTCHRIQGGFRTVILRAQKSKQLHIFAQSFRELAPFCTSGARVSRPQVDGTIIHPVMGVYSSMVEKISRRRGGISGSRARTGVFPYLR